jgi:hypothetical protein
MPKRTPVTATAAYDNFQYLLAEMEASLKHGAIQWTAESASAAERRLAKIFAEVVFIANRLRAN